MTRNRGEAPRGEKELSDLRCLVYKQFAIKVRTFIAAVLFLRLFLRSATLIVYVA
jgi:hypothetical protein